MTAEPLPWASIVELFDRVRQAPPPPKLIEESDEGLLRDFLARNGHIAARSPLWTPSSSLLGVPVAVNADLPPGTLRVTHADGTTDTFPVS